MKKSLIEIDEKKFLFYVGGDCPTFAEDYDKLAANCPSYSDIKLTDDDYAAIAFIWNNKFPLKLFYT